MFNIRYYYTAGDDESPVHEFIETLDVKEQAKVIRNISLLAEFGEKATRPLTDTVRGKIRELRIELSKNQFRILYYFCTGRNIVLLHGFKKKTEQLKNRDIETAEKRMADFERRIKAGEIDL
jgi:phage-related protein